MAGGSAGIFVNGNGNGNSNRIRRIAIFSGNRAEYGLQFPILKAIAADPRLEYHLLVSGAHLKNDFGRTLSEIEKDGFTIHEQINIGVLDDSLVATASAIGSLVSVISAVLARLQPDFFVVYA